MYKNILAPVDLSHGDTGARILRLAREMAGPDGTVTTLHVLDAIPTYVAMRLPVGTVEAHHAEARETLERLAQSIEPPAAVAVRQGSAATEILAEAEALKPDAILLGSHRPDLRDYLIGSTAARVVRHAQCSVIVDRG